MSEEEQIPLYYDFDPFPLLEAEVDELRSTLMSPGWKIFEKMRRYEANVSGSHSMDMTWLDAGIESDMGLTLEEHRAAHRAIYKACKHDLELRDRLKAATRGIDPVPAEQLPITPDTMAPEL